jgi:D-serine deaminase-like pyridoxal phosphate-dependent protein
VIYPEIVDANIRATLRMMDGDPNRWRPHIKTSKIPSVIRQTIGHGIRAFKCSTTLELLIACEAGAEDVLLAFPVTGASARRAAEIALAFPKTQVSFLVESSEQLALVGDAGVFIDVNPGMNRTGIGQGCADAICDLARRIGGAFRGLHYYDGHMASVPAEEREKVAHTGYDRLLEIIQTLPAVAEVITSGTPAAPWALSHDGLRAGPFLHRVSPGTVIYSDLTSLEQLAGYGYAPAAVVLSTVVSHPAPGIFTCDAGHKSVSADAGTPTCAVIGYEDMHGLKPSEEHLPIDAGTAEVPALGTQIYLVPRHVCPTVNNFDEAIIVVNGKVRGVEQVAARGHESPLKR